MDSVSDETLALRRRARSSTPTATGHAPGAERLRAARRPVHARVAAPGICEDIALLLAHEKGAELIVAVGTHFNLVEFLERDRAGHVLDVRDAAEGGGDPRRREGRLAARQPPAWASGRSLVLAARRRSRRSSSPSSPRRRSADLVTSARGAPSAPAASRLRLRVFDLRYHVASLAAVFLALVDRDPRRRRHLRARLRRRRGARPLQGADRERCRSRSTPRTRGRGPASGASRRREDFVESAYPVLVDRPARRASGSPCSSSARSARRSTPSSARCARATRARPCACARSRCRSARRDRSRRCSREPELGGYVGEDNLGEPRAATRPGARRRRRDAALGRALGRPRRGARRATRASPPTASSWSATAEPQAGPDRRASSPGSTAGSAAPARPGGRRRAGPASSRARSRSSSATASRPWTASTRELGRLALVLLLAGAEPGRLRRPRHGRRRDPAADRAAAARD